MRKLTYEIYNGNEKINEVSTYKEMQEMKAKGYIAKDKLTEIHERAVFEVYKGKEKINEISTWTDKKDYLDLGCTLKRIQKVY